MASAACNTITILPTVVVPHTRAWSAPRLGRASRTRPRAAFARVRTSGTPWFLATAERWKVQTALASAERWPADVVSKVPIQFLDDLAANPSKCARLYCPRAVKRCVALSPPT
ncbi:hypothetical protein PENSPDRAFT_646752 [Peniophora sp. CONT]|nr:hypothetical protein PENSPDRAFT_646752 [Peniophora sp. CONT]